MRAWFRVFWCLSVLLCFIPTSYAADKWLSVRSRNFLLVGNSSESSIRRVGRDLEQFRAALAMVFPSVNQQSTTDTTVIVFKDDAAFRPFKPLYEGKAGNVAGFFQAGQDVNFIALSTDARTAHVVYHEFVHSLTKDSALPLPPWASEGFAEVYSMFEISGKEFILGRAIGEHIQTLNQERMLPLKVLFSVDRDSPYYNERTKQGMFYAQSWASIHYLLFANNGKRRLQLTKYLNLALNGKTTDENFREAFETDYATLEEEIRKYVQNQVAWPAIKIKLPDKLDFDAEMQLSSLSDAQGQYYLGDLLLHMNRLNEAEAQLQKAAALDPQFSGSYASLALLKVRQGKWQEALQPLARAVEADSKNYLAHYYYAYMLQQRADAGSANEDMTAWDVVRTHTERAIELAPHFAEAYGMLGYVALVSKQKTVEAEDALKKAIGYAPGRLDLRLRLAELMVVNNEAPAARTLLTVLQNSGSDDRIRMQADRLLENIKNREDYERDLKEYEQRRREFEQIARDVSPAGDTIDGPPRLVRGRIEDTGKTTQEAVIETAAPQLAGPEGTRIEGMLTQVDCTNGLTLRVRAGATTVDLHTDTPANVQFMSYVADIKDTIACGVAKPEIPVAVTYRRSSNRQFFGEPLRVDFVKPK